MTVQVLRWSALGVGVFYGFYHNQALKSQAAQHAAAAEWQHKESLITQAKAQWAKDHPQEKSQPSSGTLQRPQSAINQSIGSRDKMRQERRLSIIEDRQSMRCWYILGDNGRTSNGMEPHG